MDLIKDLSLLIKAWPFDKNERVLGMLSCEFCTYAGFTTNLVFEDFGGFSKLENQRVCFWPFNLKRNMFNLL